MEREHLIVILLYFVLWECDVPIIWLMASPLCLVLASFSEAVVGVSLLTVIYFLKVG